MASADAASRAGSARPRREDTVEPDEYNGSTVLSICIAAPLHAGVFGTAPDGRRPVLSQLAPGNPGIHLVSAACRRDRALRPA
ncbi:hypothetical protein Stube_65510 [Streptomyces tubercidicus]|uniref:Uncharacterized protein n=1 Tax=Streptomyces tubercidicus TaxID=47759 RepID=A0A640V064_9ACTN|nr:hypothetical protein Stube_65510 [Streptomyces tubercidicus]